MSDGIELRPATEADIRVFAKGETIPTVRAVAGVKDGEVLGIGGYRYATFGAQRRLVLFVDLKPEARKYRKAIVRGLRMVLKMARGLPMVAICNPEEPGAPRLLKHLGFERIAPSPLGEIYRWR